MTVKEVPRGGVNKLSSSARARNPSFGERHRGAERGEIPRLRFAPRGMTVEGAPRGMTVEGAPRGMTVEGAPRRMTVEETPRGIGQQ